MVSVIFPTMWKPNFALDTLKEVSQNEHVGEIIIIDNSDKERDISEIKKVVYIKEPTNTYVNPAWNKGVKLAKYDKIFLLSDDVISNWDIISLLYDYITEDKGIIGPYWECWHDKQNGDGPYLESTQNMVNCYGAAMFFHKNSYTEIPEELKIHYGDNWIFNKSPKPNFNIHNWRFKGDSEITSGLPQFSEIKNQDKLNYLRLINE